MPECTDCGAHVSAEYARVCGDNDNRVGCPDCRVNNLDPRSRVIGDAAKTYRVAPP